MKTKLKFVILTLLGTGLAFSCSKNDHPTPEASCKIIGSTSVKENNQPSITQINYNTDGTLGSASFTHDYASYTSEAIWSYEPNKIIHKWYNDDKMVNKKHIELNANGDPVNMTIDFYDNNGNVYHTNLIAFEYNEQRQLVKSILKSGNDPETATNYTWAEGNLIEEAGENSTDTYEYHTNLTVQQGDYVGLTRMLNNGIQTFTNKNLLKSWKRNSAGNEFIRTYDYQVDADGKISKYTVKQTENNVTENREVSLEYRCE